MFSKIRNLRSSYKLITNFYSTQHAQKSPIKYTNTINLPKTKFPNRLSPTKRLEIERALFEGALASVYSHQEQNKSRTEFVLHDGPPYANGDLHMGHAVNKILKDITLKHNLMKENKIHYVPGWDCHGLPIELKAMASKSKSKEQKADPIGIRTKSRKFALDTVERQKEEFKSWGVSADWNKTDQIYRTLEPSYISKQLEVFMDFYRKGLVYRDLKPVYWSPSSRTALAEAELEYDPHFKSPSVVFRLKLTSFPVEAVNGNIFALVWTTTPWTLPSNQAVCYNPDLEYSIVNLSSDSQNQYLLATNLIEEFQKLAQVDVEVVGTVKGEDLTSCKYLHPINKSEELPFLPGSHVQDTKGTGLVHTAPAHGPDDFLVFLENKMPVKCFVNEEGIYTKDAPNFLVGKEVLSSGDSLVLDHIKDDLVFSGTLLHSYPIDWRTKKPIIIRASEQWFINTDCLKDKAVEEIEKISFFPKVNSDANKKAFITQIRKRPYWCISRQRAWGVPIPVFYEKATHKILLNENIIQHITSEIQKEGNIDFWWSRSVEELLPTSILAELGLGANEIEKGTDIFDIWFDSGISWCNVLKGNQVADLYVEGFDQFTGWFQSSLLTSVAYRDCAPYKSIFVHGFTVDEKGYKMSKSIGNVISPVDIRKKYGTDALRWWVAAHGTQHTSITVSDSLLQKSAENLSKIRATLRYLNGVVATKSDEEAVLEYKKLTYLDKYLLHELFHFEKEIQSNYDSYDYNRTITAIQNFVANQISSTYVHLVKDSLYCGFDSEYNAIKSVLINCYGVLCKSLWPVVPFVVEESWSYYDQRPFYESKISTSSDWNNPHAKAVVEAALAAKRILNQKAKDTNSWNLKCTIKCSPENLELLKNIHPEGGVSSGTSELCSLLQVSEVTLVEGTSSDFDVEVESVDKPLCPRCRRFVVNCVDDICVRCGSVIESKNL